jgi:hypothetical protein
MLSETVRADAREGDIGMQLGEIAKANPEVAIGSYPFFDPQHGPNTYVVLRARDAPKLAQAKREVEEMLERVRHYGLSADDISNFSPMDGAFEDWFEATLRSSARGGRRLAQSPLSRHRCLLIKMRR